MKIVQIDYIVQWENEEYSFVLIGQCPALHMSRISFIFLASVNPKSMKPTVIKPIALW